ncbi:hypothetical protein chiPu_0030610, partial [Chiloscyllium punctatum]|nr:hypothetical protein [Chiloscyllium punctatum]
REQKSRPEDQRRLDLEERAALGHDVAPGRRLRRDAGAEERQDRLGQDRGRADISALHDQRRDRVRHQMPPHDLRQARAERDRGLDIGLLARGQHHRAHQACYARDLGDGDRDHHGPDAGARQRDHGDCEQNGRDRHQAVHHAHHHRIDPAEEAGDEADQEPDGDRADGGAEPDYQRDPRAVDDARQQVASIGVGAEQILRARRLQPQRRRQQEWITRRKERREDRHQDDEDETDRCDRDDRR